MPVREISYNGGIKGNQKSIADLNGRLEIFTFHQITLMRSLEFLQPIFQIPALFSHLKFHFIDVFIEQKKT